MKTNWQNDYERVERVIRAFAQYIKELKPNSSFESPSESLSDETQLARVAKRAGLSSSQFHRVFHRFAGVTPKTFFQVLSSNELVAELDAGKSVLEATLASGLSSPGRAHDLMIKVEQMTPGEFKRRGAGQTLKYGFAPTPFGRGFFGWNDRGLMKLAFVDASSRRSDLLSIQEFRARWNQAQFEVDSKGAALWSNQIFSQFSSQLSRPSRLSTKPITLILAGTPFQILVWRALLELPEKTLLGYGTLADQVGRPRAARAVGTAVGANEIAWLIPCHRVLRESGALGGYRWGIERKQAMLAQELISSRTGFDTHNNLAPEAPRVRGSSLRRLSRPR